jgi:hypothetical protein
VPEYVRMYVCNSVTKHFKDRIERVKNIAFVTANIAACWDVSVVRQEATKV